MSLLLVGAGQGFGQNLIPNPSFEEYTTCPDAEGQIDYAVGWQTCRGSSDYFNECGEPELFGVPSNLLGYQHAATGSGYAHVICYAGNSQDSIAYREWIGISLSSALQIGTTYYASVRISCAGQSDSIISLARYATNKFGFRFAGQSFLGEDFQLVPNQAHVYSEQVVTDTAEWTVIAGSFIADSAYTFVALGNFFGDLSTDTVLLFPDGIHYMSNYYVDDVCVSADATYCPLPVGIEPYPFKNQILHASVFSDQLLLRGPRSAFGHVGLITMDGKVVRIGSAMTDDGVVLFTGSLADGPYVVHISSEGRRVYSSLVFRVSDH